LKGTIEKKIIIALETENDIYFNFFCVKTTLILKWME